MEVAQFLCKKFSNVLEEAGTDPSLPYISEFQAIKGIIEKKNIISSSMTSVTRPLLYDLNDLLAECRIFALQRKEMNKDLLRLNPFPEFLLNRRMKKRLSNIKEQLEKMDDGELTPMISFPTERQTFPAVDTSTIIGFDDQAAKIEDWLFGHGFNNGFTAIGIVGMGGAGKTMLAKMVFNSSRVQNNFSPRIWVCLWNTLSKGEDIRGKILKYLLGELGYDVGELTSDIGTDRIVELLETLNCLLLGKRYLIVLDDVWHIPDWYMGLGYKLSEGERIRDFFSHGLPKGRGGAIIVTSRYEGVAKGMVGEKNSLHLDPLLSKENCWSIFENTVYKDRIIKLDNHTLLKMKDEIKDQCDGLPLAAKTLAMIIPIQIREMESNRFLKDFYIPDYMLVPDFAVETAGHIPKCPVLVFIDLETDGVLGEKLLVTFRSLLNKNQVFGLRDESPDKVLHKVYGTLEKLKLGGHGFAFEIQKRLRIIVVGGDAVANLLVGVVSDLKLLGSPSIATIPLGSENNIPFSFGWGKKNLNADRKSVTTFLDQVVKAKEMRTDSWHIFIRMRTSPPDASPPDAIAPCGMPHSLHMFGSILQTDLQNTESVVTFQGGFWNYFSMGIDTQRWRGASCFRPSSRTIAMLANVWIMKQHGQWEDLRIPGSIRSILFLNLPSFPGGLNPWGAPNIKKEKDKGLTLPLIDDGLLEVIGFRDFILAQDGHGIFLAQACRIRIVFDKGGADVKMRIDGELWEQTPVNDIVEIEISHSSQTNMLATPDCPSKSILDSLPPSGSKHQEDESTEDDSEEDLEERKKFGMASSFRIPDHI